MSKIGGTFQNVDTIDDQSRIALRELNVLYVSTDGEGMHWFELPEEINDPLTHYAKSTEACGLDINEIVFSRHDLPIEPIGPDGRPDPASKAPKFFSTYEDALAELERQKADEDREIDD